MNSLRERVNGNFKPILSSAPLESWRRPKFEVKGTDPQTCELIQLDDLYNAINYTETKTGSWVLERSLLQPLTDVEIITKKQKSLEELRSDSSLRNKICEVIDVTARDEENLYDLLRRNYFLGLASKYDSRKNSIYDVYKGAARLLNTLATGLDGVKPETEYLGALLDNLTALREDDIYRLIRGPVYKTSEGVKPQEGKGILPRLVFKATDLKPIRLAALAAPLAIPVAGLLTGSHDVASVAVVEFFAAGPWIQFITGRGREFDDNNYVNPLAEKYSSNINVVNAVETLGKIDELQSLAQYADNLQVPVTLPEVSDTQVHHFKVKGLRNPVMVKDNPYYVANDVELDGGITFLTGPNSGGKTSLSKTILQAQTLAQIGSYIPAESAWISVADGRFYHSPMVNSLQDSEGRFGVEIARTKEIFFKSTPKTLTILDELIEATTYEEKIKHSRAIMEGFNAIGGNTILVTHNHELAQHFRDKGVGQFWQVEFDGKEPTHRIIPGISSDSHADQVLARLGFAEKDIQRHLRNLGNIHA